MADATEPIDRVGQLDETSASYVGRWSHLVSRTNWEKGRIILEWRAALGAEGRPTSSYSDEAWAQKVGGVTPQHVGRLRRVYQRFGESHEQYAGLYWSHFQAALEWDDAEMWLEGAVQNGWSVAVMRKQRAETLGKSSDDPIAVGEVVEIDASYLQALDAVPVLPDTSEPGAAGRGKRPTGKTKSAPASDATGDDVPFDVISADDSSADRAGSDDALADGEPVVVRPFEAISEDLPEDLQEALELFKLAILRHRQAEWRDVAPSDVVAALEGLRRLIDAG